VWYDITHDGHKCYKVWQRYDIKKMLQLKDFRASQGEEPCIRVNIRELNRELYTGLSTLYTQTDGLCYYCD